MDLYIREYLMGRPRKIVQEKEDKVDLSTKTDLLDIVAEVIQHYCGIPGCSAKWHREEAQIIINRLRSQGLLKEVD